MKMTMTTLATSFLSFFSLGCSIFGYRSEETPRYTIISKQDAFEIRKYSTYLAAQTEVEGEYKDAQNKAFRILANFIFGENKARESISMTAPVVQSPKSEKISMTAPVIMSESKNTWVMTFMMPSKYTLESLPEPLDARVKIITVPEKYFAVRTYSGFWSKEKNDEYGNELKKWIASMNEWSAKDTIQFAGYNPPWTLPFLRKNEALIELIPK